MVFLLCLPHTTPPVCLYPWHASDDPIDSSNNNSDNDDVGSYASDIGGGDIFHHPSAPPSPSHHNYGGAPLFHPHSNSNHHSHHPPIDNFFPSSKNHLRPSNNNHNNIKISSKSYQHFNFNPFSLPMLYSNGSSTSSNTNKDSTNLKNSSSHSSKNSNNNKTSSTSKKNARRINGSKSPNMKAKNSCVMRSHSSHATTKVNASSSKCRSGKCGKKCPYGGGNYFSILNPFLNPSLLLPGYLGGSQQQTSCGSPPAARGGAGCPNNKANDDGSNCSMDSQQGSHSAQSSPTSTLKSVRPRARSADETVSGKKVSPLQR